MTVEEVVRDTLNRYRDDEIMVDAFVQWASNPTSMSAGYGIEENYPCIARNLMERYSLTSKEVEHYIEKLKAACNQFLQQTEDVYELRRIIQEEFCSELGQALRRGIVNRIQNASLDAKRVISLLTELRERGHSEAGWESIQDKVQSYFAAVHGVIMSPERMRKDLVKVGLINRLLWITSKGHRKESYVLMPIPPADAIGLTSVELAPKSDTAEYIKALFDKRSYEQLRILDEVSRENFGILTYYGEVPSFLSAKGICGQHADTLAISPFVLDEVRENLHLEKEERLGEIKERVENALVFLRNQLWPECELIFFQSKREEILWRWDSSTSPPLYIYLAPWLTRPNLSDLTSYINMDYRMHKNNIHLMVMTAYQSLPSIKRLLESSFSLYRSTPISLVLISDGSLRYEILKDEAHPYAHQIVEAIQAVFSNLAQQIALVKLKLPAAVSVEPQPQPLKPPEKGITKTEQRLILELRVLLGSSDSGQVFWLPSNERNWNFVIVGSAGTGKTQTVKAILDELAKLGLPYIVFDFRNDYISVETKASDFGKVLDLSSISINPLEFDGTNSPRDQKYQVSDIIDLVYNIGERQIGYIRDAIKMSYVGKGIYEDNKDSWKNAPPTFIDIERNLNRLSEEGGRAEKDSIKGIFARLDPIFDYGIFSTKTVMPFEQIMKSHTIVDLGVLPNDNLKAVVCEFLQRKLRYYLYGLSESREPRLYVVIDEAHRLKYEKGSSTGQLLKEARKYGVGLILSTQDPVDFPDLVYNNVGGVLSLQLTDPKYAKSVAEHLGGTVSWQNIKNELSVKFSAYAKFSSQRDVVKLKVTPYYERKVKR